MKIFHIFIALFGGIMLAGCAANEDIDDSSENSSADARALQGIEAVIDGAASKANTRATLVALADYVGRKVFVDGDELLFTKLHQTRWHCI